MKKLLIYAATAGIILLAAYLVFQAKTPGNKVQVFFFSDGKVAPVERNLTEGENAARTAARELLKGPNAEEKKKGYFTQIPAGTRLLNIGVRSRTAIADFSRHLGMYGGGTTRVQAMVAQIVYTLTGPGTNADKVQIMIEGKKREALGGEGYTIDKPLSRKDVTY